MNAAPKTIRQYVMHLFSAMIAIFAPATAQWSSDQTVNNAICTAANVQYIYSIVSDGAGGALLAWEDQRSGSKYDIYVQRVDFSGAVQWSANGIAACTATNNQFGARIISDGSGGAVIVWEDYRNGNTNANIFAQKITASGDTVWSANGIAVCTAAGNQQRPKIISDDSGGAIIVWRDYRNGSSNPDIYAQRINFSGNVVWDSNGVIVCSAANRQNDYAITGDEAGGAIIAWDDFRSNESYDVYAQRIDYSGVAQWTADGIPVCIRAGGYQGSPDITTDGSGGVIIAWRDRLSDFESYSERIYAQRVNASGDTLWPLNGIGISVSDTTIDAYPKIAGDGAGGVIIVWQQFFETPVVTYDIYAQHVNATGSIVWGDGAIAVCSATGAQNYPVVVEDGSGGVIIAWMDYRNGSTNSDIYAQQLDALGTAQWSVDGIEICTKNGNQELPVLLGDGAGDAILAWSDKRNGNYDIFASRISSNGTLPVELRSFVASVEQNGVALHWTTATEEGNYGFEIERSMSGNRLVDVNSSLQWQKIGFIEGNGTTNSSTSYSFFDASVKGKISYRLKQINNDGRYEFSHSVEVTVNNMPKDFFLEQNHPNPFNPSTVISYQLPVNRHVSLKVYDAIGREVATLVNEVQEAGRYTVKFDASRLSGGIYFCTLKAANAILTRKMVLMK